MSLPVSCIAAAWLLLYLPRLVVLFAQARQPEGYDNRHPREQQARLQGWASRARAAEQNGHESFAAYAAAVLLCLVCGVEGLPLVLPCVSFLALRTLYVGLYVFDVHWARTLVWGGAFLSIGALFSAAISSASALSAGP